MAKDAKLIFSFPSQAAAAPLLATTTSGIVTGKQIGRAHV